MSDGEMDLPHGVVSRRGRWAGEQMEMEHQQDSFRNEKSKATAAVDIRQFQNNVVGEGYQAKHVVRQASAPKISAVRDMTGGAAMRESSKSTTHGVTPVSAEMLLQNDALRAFRREIEDLLK